MKMWMRGVVVVGLTAVVSGAPLEAQRPVRGHAASMRARVVVRPVHRPARVSRAAVVCDLREDVWDRREDRRDRAEDVRDRREDRLDALFDGGRRDRLEDIRDRREDRRDRLEDVRDRREDRWDRRHIGTRPAFCRARR